MSNSAFGGSVWGSFQWGQPGSASAVGGVALSTIIYNAFRIANILKGPQYQPSPDDVTEAILALDSLLNQWSTERLMIYSINRVVENLVSGQSVYTIGPGSTTNWTMPWPPRIDRASVILESNQPQPLELAMQMLTVEEWQHVPIKNVPSNFPLWAYYDRAFPIGNFNVYPVPQETNQVALYLWQLLPCFSTALGGSSFLVLPLGYQRCIEHNLAVELYARYPAESVVSQIVLAEARASKAAVKSINATPVVSACDSAALTHRPTGTWDYRIGDFR
jgi:hypothetical protein